MLNWQLMKNPLNWLIVGLMLTLLGIAGHILLTHFGAEPAGPDEESGTLNIPPGEMNRQQVAAAVLD